MKIVVFSDIHANLTALRAVLLDCTSRYPGIKCVVLLGDLVNYGPRPNETLMELKSFLEGKELLASIVGNHEMELFREEGPSPLFSTERGMVALVATKRLLSPEWLSFLKTRLNTGIQEITVESKRILCVHASFGDPYWGVMTDEGRKCLEYASYDFVLFGHTHIPLAVDEFFPVENATLQNRKKTVFLNPGSVGQPRNRNPLAHYMVFDPITEEVHLNKVPYNVQSEMDLDVIEGLDQFYRERLKYGL